MKNLLTFSVLFVIGLYGCEKDPTFLAYGDQEIFNEVHSFVRNKKFHKSPNPAYFKVSDLKIEFLGDDGEVRKFDIEERWGDDEGIFWVAEYRGEGYIFQAKKVTDGERRIIGRAIDPDGKTILALSLEY